MCRDYILEWDRHVKGLGKRIWSNSSDCSCGCNSNQDFNSGACFISIASACTKIDRKEKVKKIKKKNKEI